ncbi:MAG: hypothetical protein CMH54_04060 [Myxococcales bacterium]|nr:hypothetical protein [Myxococcales bacterium]
MNIRVSSFWSIFFLFVLATALACGSSSGDGAPSQDTGNGTDFSIGFGDSTSYDIPANTDTNVGDTAQGTDGASGVDATGAQSIPSAEMVLKIVSPTAHPYGTFASTTGFLTGIVTGVPDTITWQTQTGATGTAEGLPFWKTSPIPLNVGDNLITVTAVRGTEVQTDSIALTVNPGFKFGSPLRAKPDVLFVGQTVNVVFAINADLYVNYVENSLELIEVDANGNALSAGVSMSDNGDISSGDEIAGDAIYGARLELSGDLPGRRFFRVRIQVKNGPGVVISYSEILPVDVFHTVPVSECQQIVELHTQAKNAYIGAVDAAGQSGAVQQALAVVQGSPNVAESGVSVNGHGVWVRYHSGLLGALSLSPEGYRGAPSESSNDGEISQTSGALLNNVYVGTRNALLLSPYANELAAEDENNAISQLFAEVECPPYIVDGPLQNNAANLNRFQEMSQYGVVSITSHGDTYFGDLSAESKSEYNWFHKGSQELIWTGEAIDCQAFNKQVGNTCTSDEACGAGSRCSIQSLAFGEPQGICVDYTQADLRAGRVVFGADRYGILPTFVRYHARTPFPSSVVYLGACRSIWNGSMAAAFFGAGARTIVGYSNYISNEFAATRGTEFFDRLIRPSEQTGKTMLSGQAHLELPDPQNADSFFRLVGAENLDASRSDLINPSFELGSSSGWFRQGDGRIISKLGDAVPVSGKFMGILSTGLGYTKDTGELSQAFCIPAGRTKMTVWWRFYSEEFLEWCGTQFQDTFQVDMETSTGNLKTVDVAVDDLCPQAQCLQCQGLHPLELSDVHFEEGEVWRMQYWARTELSLVGTGLPGGPPVTIRLYATDVGDSIYDSAILIDDIKIE